MTTFSEASPANMKYTYVPPRSALTTPSWSMDTLLPTAAPNRLYLKSSTHGIMAFAELHEETTIDDLKHLISERQLHQPASLLFFPCPP